MNVYREKLANLQNEITREKNKFTQTYGKAVLETRTKIAKLEKEQSKYKELIGADIAYEIALQNNLDSCYVSESEEICKILINDGYSVVYETRKIKNNEQLYSNETQYNIKQACFMDKNIFARTVARCGQGAALDPTCD